MFTLKSEIQTASGFAIGRAFVASDGKNIHYLKGTVEEELSKFKESLVSCIEDATRLSETNPLFRAHKEILEDEMLSDTVTGYIESGCSSFDAVKKTSVELQAMFQDIDDQYLRERSMDVRDVCNRLCEAIVGASADRFGGLKKGDVLCASSMDPSELMKLNLDMVSAIVTSDGGATSHICIIAKNNSIPIIVGIGDGLSSIHPGDRLLVDAMNGSVIVNPEKDTEEEFRRLSQDYFSALKNLDTNLEWEGETVKILANAGSEQEIRRGIENGAQGVGLLRTEFLFMNMDHCPNEDEQTAFYTSCAEACAGEILTIRTLDVGGDKNIPYLDFPRENNPFMGLRGIRFLLKNKEILYTQLRAILRASHLGNVRIMFPMICTEDEITEAKRALKECMTELEKKNVPFDKDIRVGIMIETPASVFIAPKLATLCDFFSIGTNDLTQYVMAADRTNESVSNLCDAGQKPLCIAVQSVIAAARSAGIECCMCGEMASDSDKTAELLSWGLREFSVSASAIASISSKISLLGKK